MKKTITFLLFIILFSCSSEQDIQGNLVKKMIFKGENVTLYLRNYNFNFIYDNEKLVKIERENKVYREFMYSGDLIVQIKYYDFWNSESEPTLSSINNFEYDQFGRLIKATTNSQFEYYFNYTDQSNAEFEIKIYTWSGNNDLYSTGNLTIDSNTNNILGLTETFYDSYLNDNGLPQPYLTINEQLIYDDKKHPCSGIKGFKDLAFFNLLNFDDDVFIAGFGATNNLMDVNQLQTNPYNSVVNHIWTYEYGSIFPSKATKVNKGDYNIYFYY